MKLLFCAFFSLLVGLSVGDNVIEGKYKLKQSENFGAYLEALNVDPILRGLSALSKPTVTISRECPSSNAPVSSPDCTWKIFTNAAVKRHTVEFRLNEKVNDKTLDGRQIQTQFTLQGDNVLVEFQDGDIDSTLTRRFSADGMSIDLEAGGVRSSAFYERRN